MASYLAVLVTHNVPSLVPSALNVKSFQESRDQSENHHRSRCNGEYPHAIVTARDDSYSLGGSRITAVQVVHEARCRFGPVTSSTPVLALQV